MVPLKQIIAYLESLYPLEYQEEYDNSGLQIGNTNTEIKKILLCLDINIEVIIEARSKHCSLIISHHPLIYTPINSITNSDYLDECIMSAIRNNIAIYSAHTNFDNANNGMNQALANILDLSDLSIIKMKTNQNIGSGVIGELNKTYLLQDFLKLVKEKFSLKVLKHTKYMGKGIKKLGICGGSGGFLIKNAKNLQIDAFITGDLRYHDYFHAHKDFLLCDIGHYESEIIFKNRIFEVISDKFSNIVVEKCETITNPVLHS